MTLDLTAADKVLAGLRPFPVAVTTIDGGFGNGLISLSAGSASIVPELPRATRCWIAMDIAASRRSW